MGFVYKGEWEYGFKRGRREREGSFLRLWHSEIGRNWESLKRETEKKEGKNVSEGKR